MKRVITTLLLLVAAIAAPAQSTFKFLRKTALWIVLAPMSIFGVGLASNQAVLMANHDKFPVMWNTYKVVQYRLEIQKALASDDPDTVEEAELRLAGLQAEGMLDDTHVLMTENTHLNALADVIDLRSATYSIGDLLLYLGEWLMGFAFPVWMFEVIRRAGKNRSKAELQKI